MLQDRTVCVGPIRQQNQDGFLISGEVYCGGNYSIKRRMNASAAIFAVADGMGGHEKGAEACDLVLNFLKSTQATTEIDVQTCLQRASERLLEIAMNQNQKRPMGATLSGFLISEEKTIGFVAGDVSAVCVCISGEFIEMNIHRRGNKLVGGIGGIRERELVQVNFLSFRNAEIDCLLLMSDGIMDYLSIENILEMRASEDVSWAATCIQAAIDNGSGDNLTFLCVTLQPR